MYVEKAKQAKRYFGKRWNKYKSYKEDFGSYCVEMWLTGRNIKTSFEYLGIDFLRAYVHSFNRGGPRDVVHRLIREDNGSFIEKVHNKKKRENRSYLFREKDLLTIERAILILYYEWGLTGNELSDCFGITECYVTKVRHKAEAKIKSILEAE